MKVLGFLLWLYCVGYAFLYWGFWWGVFNIFFPSAPVIDLIKHLGKIQ